MVCKAVRAPRSRCSPLYPVGQGRHGDVHQFLNSPPRIYPSSWRLRKEAGLWKKQALATILVRTATIHGPALLSTCHVSGQIVVCESRTRGTTSVSSSMATFPMAMADDVSGADVTRTPKEATVSEQSLYDRLGGIFAIAAVVD